MVDLWTQTEAPPASYPAVPSGLSTAAAALDSGAIWQRIEAYCAHRWTPREVVWKLYADGEAEWKPPLSPVVSREAHYWGDQWEALTVSDGPLGICLPFSGTYQITAQVGAGPVPAAVSEAFRRLAEYCADTDERSGASEYSLDLGPIKEGFERSPTWLARALSLSGAADLLRPYRRA